MNSLYEILWTTTLSSTLSILESVFDSFWKSIHIQGHLRTKVENRIQICLFDWWQTVFKWVWYSSMRMMGFIEEMDSDFLTEIFLFIIIQCLQGTLSITKTERYVVILNHVGWIEWQRIVSCFALPSTVKIILDFPDHIS